MLRLPLVLLQGPKTAPPHEWIRADQVQRGDVVYVPGGGSSRAHFAPDVPPPDGAEPRRVRSVEAPGSFTLEDGHVCTYGRATPVLRLTLSS